MTQPTDLELVVYDAREHAAQPYPIWADSRARCPVARADGLGYGTRGQRPNYQVTTWADVQTVLRDADTFASCINAEGFGRRIGETILAMDGAEHRTHRGLVAPAFRASQLEQWSDTLVGPTISRLLDAVAPNGRSDLVADVTRPYPMEVICGILGVPLHDVEVFMRWAEEMSIGDDASGMEAAAAMRRYLEPIVEDRRTNPCGDLVSDLVHTEVDGERLTDGKLYGFLLQLLPAGAETTYWVMGSTLVALLTVPGLLERVRDDRSVVPALIEETLRWETSITRVARLATRDTTISGCPIPAGAAVNVFTASANHDETRYDRADVFDIDRRPEPHVAFGTGQHQCLGMHLARLELRVGLNAILDRLPNLRLDTEHPPPTIAGFTFRGPSELHVRFDPT